MERKKILHLRSNKLQDGKPLSPQISDIDFGEIAINYNKDNERIFIKNSENEIVSFSKSLMTDNEDITFQKIDNENYLRIANRNYDKDRYTGKGFIILRKNFINVIDYEKITDFETITDIENNKRTFESETLSGDVNKIILNPTYNIIYVVSNNKYYTSWNSDEYPMDNYLLENKPKINTIYRLNNSEICYIFKEEKFKEYGIEDGAPTKIINSLNQESFSSENTIYEIRYDFDLNKNTIILPENSELYFNGGSIYNGNIEGSNIITNIHEGTIKNLNNSITYNDNSFQYHKNNIQFDIDDVINCHKKCDYNYINSDYNIYITNQEDLDNLETKLTDYLKLNKETEKTINVLFYGGHYRFYGRNGSTMSWYTPFIYTYIKGFSGDILKDITIRFMGLPGQDVYLHGSDIVLEPKDAIDVTDTHVIYDISKWNDKLVSFNVVNGYERIKHSTSEIYKCEGYEDLSSTEEGGCRFLIPETLKEVLSNKDENYFKGSILLYYQWFTIGKTKIKKSDDKYIYLYNKVSIEKFAFYDCLYFINNNTLASSDNKLYIPLQYGKIYLCNHNCFLGMSSGIKNLIFSNIKFLGAGETDDEREGYTGWSTLIATPGNKDYMSLIIQNCEFDGYDNRVIYSYNWGSSGDFNKVIISNNKIKNGGFSIRGKNCIVTNNKFNFDDFNILYGTMNISLVEGYKSTVKNNEFINCGRLPLIFSGPCPKDGSITTDVLIEHNFFKQDSKNSNLSYAPGDAGIIYVNLAGCKIYENVLLNCSGGDYSQQAIFADNYSSNIDIQRNILYASGLGNSNDGAVKINAFTYDTGEQVCNGNIIKNNFITGGYVFGGCNLSSYTRNIIDNNIICLKYKESSIRISYPKEQTDVLNGDVYDETSYLYDNTLFVTTSLSKLGLSNWMKGYVKNIGAKYVPNTLPLNNKGLINYNDDVMNITQVTNGEEYTLDGFNAVNVITL